MKNGERTWIVHDRELDIRTAIVQVIVRAGTKQEALGEAYDMVFEELGRGFAHLEADKAPWLDGYENLDDSDAAKEMRLHAQQACGKADKQTSEQRQGLTMPIDTLADAMDSSQYQRAIDSDPLRSLDEAADALVDIAVSLRALSGRPPVTDTPMQQRMREAIDKGKAPRKAGLPPATRYVEAFERAYKPRSAANPSPSADGTGKQQEDGKESVSEHSGEES